MLWALCTRTEVTEDVDIVKRMWSTSLDPMAYAGDGGQRYYNNRMIIDACRPYDRLATFPPVARKTQAESGRAASAMAGALHAGRQGAQGRAQGVTRRELARTQPAGMHKVDRTGGCASGFVMHLTPSFR